MGNDLKFLQNPVHIDSPVKDLHEQRNRKRWKIQTRNEREMNSKKTKQKTVVATNYQRRSFKQFPKPWRNRRSVMAYSIAGKFYFSFDMAGFLNILWTTESSLEI